jgi:hypothetical protein
LQQYNIDQLKIYFRKSWKVVFNGIVISVKNEQLVKQMARTILQEELSKVRTGFDKVIQMARTILLEELAKVRTGFDQVIQMARTILQEELAKVRTGFDKVVQMAKINFRRNYLCSGLVLIR